MMIERSEIPYIHWQKRLVAAGSDMLSGEIVSDFSDIEQEITVIVSTMIGSVPTNPLKGCDLMPLIDMPSEEATPLICQKIWDAITAWVVRVEVDTITATPVDIHHWKVTIPWRPRGDVLAQFKNFDLNVRLAGGFAYAS